MNTSIASLPSKDVIVRLKTVMAVTGLSRSSIYRAVDNGEFPKPVALSTSTARNAPIGWVLAEVQDWVQQRIAQRDAQQVGGAQ